MKPFAPIAAATALLVLGQPALAHVGAGDASHLAAGLGHPFSGLDHIAAMVAVGLWAALRGGKALWVWPAAFVATMLLGGIAGMAGMPVPFVEPGILASIVVLGLLVAIGAELPVAIGAAIIAAFALFHGFAHGVEAPETGSGIAYLAGFALATASLHGVGIAAALAGGSRLPSLARTGGLACAVVGVGLAVGLL